MALTAKRCYEYAINHINKIWVGNDHHIKIQDGSKYKIQKTEILLDKRMFTGNSKIIRK